MRNPFQIKSWSKGSLEDRFRMIEPYVRGREVLDVGCVVGHHRPDWMHGLIRSVAARVKGIDIDEPNVQKLRAKGFDIQYADARNFDLGETFDVVFAGELLEHLDNFQGFFQSVQKHLKEDGILVITTPNVFAFTNFFYRLWGEVRINTDHTCWFCEDTFLSGTGLRCPRSNMCHTVRRGKFVAGSQWQSEKCCLQGLRGTQS